MIPNAQNLSYERLHRCWWRNVLVTTIRCWWRIWPFWSPKSTIFYIGVGHPHSKDVVNIEIRSLMSRNNHQHHCHHMNSNRDSDHIEPKPDRTETRPVLTRASENEPKSYYFFSEHYKHAREAHCNSVQCNPTTHPQHHQPAASVELIKTEAGCCWTGSDQIKWACSSFISQSEFILLICLFFQRFMLPKRTASGKLHKQKNSWKFMKKLYKYLFVCKNVLIYWINLRKS